MANIPNNPEGNPLPFGNAQTPAVAAPAREQPAPPRNRRPRRADRPNVATSTDAPAILELAALYPLRTVQRDGPNTFVPDCQMMFHVLGICDQLMVPTDRFIRSNPAWLPIVSQLYVSFLWITHVLKVQAHSGLGLRFRTLIADLLESLNLNDCMIPGPLVPFFQAVTATNGPYEWSGDIIPVLPTFRALWNEANTCIEQVFARFIPFPAMLLDQLVRFSRTVPQAGQLPYDTFLWYSNVFGVPFDEHSRALQLGPQLCGSLHVSRAQFNSAHRFWSTRLRDFSLVDLTEDRFSGYPHLLGVTSTSDDSSQTSWFLQVSITMQNYCHHFSGSTTLGSILTTGLGASAVHGVPIRTRAVDNWFYPRNNRIRPFSSSLVEAIRPIPPTLRVVFQHSDFEVEEQAEFYAILTHTNLDWSSIICRSNTLDTLDNSRVRTGRYWNALHHRINDPTSISAQFQQLISAVYHRQAAQNED